MYRRLDELQSRRENANIFPLTGIPLQYKNGNLLLTLTTKNFVPFSPQANYID
jgi:hypothetical protein